LMMSLWDALRMNMMISYQELVRTFPNCLTNPLWKQGKSWKTLTIILLLTRCYSDCLYKTTAGKFATNYFRR
ncbi:hypothetical protein PO638_07480, partial [Escherichia coli]